MIMSDNFDSILTSKFILDEAEEVANTSDEDFINDGEISERSWSTENNVRLYSISFIYLFILIRN